MPVSDELVTVTLDAGQKALQIALELMRALRETAQGVASNITEINKPLKGEIDYKALQSLTEKSNSMVKMQSGIMENDRAAIASLANQYNIPVAFVAPNNGTYKLAFNTAHAETVNTILQDMVANKLEAGKSEYNMFELKESEVSSIKEAFTQHNVPADFVKDNNGKIQCIYPVSAAATVAAIKDEYKTARAEIDADFSHKVENGKLTLSDKSGKTVTLNQLPTQAKLERVLTERFGYDKVKAREASLKFGNSLSVRQQAYFKVDTTQIEIINKYHQNIRLPEDHILTKPFTYSSVNFKTDNVNKLLISNGERVAEVVPSRMTRADIEATITTKLGVTEKLTVQALADKAETVDAELKKRALVNKTNTKSEVATSGEYKIDRMTQNKFQVEYDGKTARYDMRDKNQTIKSMCADFGMTKQKAEKIIGKVSKQSALQNELKNVPSLPKTPPLQKKMQSKGARK